MKKVLLSIPLLFSLLFLSGCSLKKAPAALQINSNPPANVFIDGKLLGKTPYQGSNWKASEISLKLIPESTTTPLASWEGKVKLANGVVTLIERDFAGSEAGSSGEILTLEKIKDNKSASLAVISDPDGALIHLDGEAKGFTPLTLDKIGVGDHQISIAKDGYTERLVKAKAVLGFKLVANIKLSQESGEETAVASVSGTPTPSKGQPTPTGKAPTPTGKAPTPTGTAQAGQVLIKETPTGWLRVRAQASTSSTEVAKVNPGDKFLLLEETSGWFKIEYETGKEGWISKQYATKI